MFQIDGQSQTGYHRASQCSFQLFGRFEVIDIEQAVAVRTFASGKGVVGVQSDGNVEKKVEGVESADNRTGRAVDEDKDRAPPL